nr:phage N-6-adenine-methyltransferase [Mycobacterium sp. UM_NZ2]
MGTDIWLTPRHILDALGPFDLDPCAAPDPKVWPTARNHIRLPDDGLACHWSGRVWCNPPYGMQAWEWLKKLANHGHGTALIFARTETAGFVETVWRSATAVLFLHGRLHFHHPDGTRAVANAGAPSCLVAYGRRDADLLEASGLPGTYVPGWCNPRGDSGVAS